MAGGSFIRFAIGIVLSLTVLASFFTGEKVSALSALLSLLFLLLAVMWIAFRF